MIAQLINKLSINLTEKVELSCDCFALIFEGINKCRGISRYKED